MPSPREFACVILTQLHFRELKLDFNKHRNWGKRWANGRAKLKVSRVEKRQLLCLLAPSPRLLHLKRKKTTHRVLYPAVLSQASCLPSHSGLVCTSSGLSTTVHAEMRNHLPFLKLF